MKNWWLYVLKLEQGKWYVGITAKTPEVRFWEHKKNIRAAAWTRRYKPLKIYATENLGKIAEVDAKEKEDMITLKFMKEFGINNVRGGHFNDQDDYVIKRNGRFFSKDVWQAAYPLYLFSVILTVICAFEAYIILRLIQR